jgi:hypothetical protein
MLNSQERRLVYQDAYVFKKYALTRQVPPAPAVHLIELIFQRKGQLSLTFLQHDHNRSVTINKKVCPVSVHKATGKQFRLRPPFLSSVFILLMAWAQHLSRCPLLFHKTKHHNGTTVHHEGLSIGQLILIIHKARTGSIEYLFP